jgi:tRNA threonylcarbamoyladenosine biosynthesis protein TsaE
MDISLPDLTATRHLGQALGRSLPTGSILLLEGTLGSGKTSLVQGLAQGLGITEPVVSPTFTLVNEYHDGRLPLYHFDLYRLNPVDVAKLYLDLYWEDSDYPLGIVALEWPDRLPQWPTPALHLSLTITDDDRRRAHLRPIGEPAAAWLEALHL